MGKIIEFINKIIDSIVFVDSQLEYSRCYDYNEGTGKAVFDMCECNDMNCPYNVSNIKEIKE